MKKILLYVVCLFIISSISYADQIAFDGFESGTFTGGSGYSDGWINTGSVSISGWSNPYEGNRHVWIRGNNAEMKRNVSVSGYSNIVLRVAVRINSFEGGDSGSLLVNGVTLRTWTSIDSDDIWRLYTFNLQEYSITGNNLEVKFVGQMSDLGDEYHIDNVEIIGDFGIPKSVTLVMDTNYITGTTIPIYMSSTEVDTLHILKLSYSGTTFCERNVLSPSVSNTLFETSCVLPETSMIDVEGFLYVTNLPSVNDTKHFNILQLSGDLNKLKIEQVYFSPKVLQGSQTEIFVVIKKSIDITISKIYTTIAFPDGSQRRLSMEPTINNGEYRSFITDTYRTGYTNFTVIVESETYTDTYSNQYYVVPFSVDYVATVGKIEEPISTTTNLKVFGTDYRIGSRSTIFLQLLDVQGNAESNGSCYVTIYYPNTPNTSHSTFIENAPMLYKNGSQGLYYYDLVIPNYTGVYMVSASCSYKESGNFVYSLDGTETNYPLKTSTLGTWVGNEIFLNDYEDWIYTECSSSAGGTKYCDAYYDFDTKVHFGNLTNITSIDLFFMGESSVVSTMRFYYWDWLTSTWVLLPNNLIFGASGSSPIGIGYFQSNILPVNSVSSTGIIRIRTEASSGQTFKLWSNWLNIKINTAIGLPQEVKGGSELNVIDWFDYLEYEIPSIYDAILNLSNTPISNDIPITMISGTEYQPNETGLIAVRLARVVGNSQQLVTGASCVGTIINSSNSTISTFNLSEYGVGLYYKNFTVPSIDGVYIYSVDCNDGLRNYYAMNTFHVRGDTQYDILSYLQSMNYTLSTIDGRTISILNVVNDSNNRLVMINGTIYDIYSLMLQMNQTMNLVYQYVDSIDGKIIDINTTLFGIEQIVLSINDTIVTIDSRLINIEGNVTDINGILYSMNSTLFDIDEKMFLLNQSNNKIYDGVLSINQSVIQINGTINGIENILLTINGTITDMYSDIKWMNFTFLDYLKDINQSKCNCSEITSYLQGLNVSISNIQYSVNNIETIILDINGTIYGIQDDIYGVEISLIQMNSTLNDVDMKIEGLDSKLIDMNGTLMYIRNKVDDIDVSIININGTIMNKLNVMDSNIVTLNGTTYLIKENIDGVVLSLLNITDTVIDTNNIVRFLNSTIIEINDTLYLIQDDLTVSLLNINNTMISIQSTTNQINGTINTIQDGILFLNTTTNDVYSGMIYINGTINGVENSLVVINGTLNSVNTKTDLILSSLVQMNVTLNGIENGVMNLTFFTNLTNVTQILFDIQGKTNNIEGLVLNINNSMDYFNSSLSTMNQTINDIKTIVLTLNTTTYEIRNITVSMNEKISDLSNLSLIINGSVFSYLSEFQYIQQLIQNQTDFLIMALSDVSYFTDKNSSDWYENLSISPSILETQMFQTYIDTIQEPFEGELYRLNYYFLNRESGDITKEIQTSVKGTGDFKLSFSSEGLRPIYKIEQIYDVWIRVEMLNGIGFYQSFPMEYVGPLKVVHLNDNGPRVGLYDVIVETKYELWDIGEIIKADILIKNTGDLPDEDTILTYWLEDSSGNRVSETKEQFLEFEPGVTIIKRELQLPLGSSPGEWRFMAEYETVVQPMISVYDSFLVYDMTIGEKLKQRLPIFVKNNMFFVLMFGFFIVLLFLIVLILKLNSPRYITKYKNDRMN